MKVDGVTETALTAAEEVYLSYNTANGELTIDTSDFGLQGTVITLKLYQESLDSTTSPSSGVNQFELTLVDPC